eukprot:TRINITY_DN25199_c0_g1_i1.p1 TRINITY_DN25199_c0_g1~~TRINITY_DN25199_c0_g1_i1.p1  ORF type:complete len:416 (+),score=122.69 TRINITY_DN25199_c0_g1_i1:47-1249(+)
MAATVPSRLEVSGITSEPGLNGVYELCPGRFQKRRCQWMKPGSRCYVRHYAARGRWELYVSHHPAGTTFFYKPDGASDLESDVPPLPSSEWLRTEYVEEDETFALKPSDERTAPPPAVAPAPQPFRLWGNKTCPYVQAVLIAAKEKGLDDEALQGARGAPVLEAAEVDVFGDKDARFVALYRTAYAGNRRPTIPLLEHGGVAVVESEVIVHYLDDAFPDAPLRPATPIARARAALLLKVMSEELCPVLHQAMNAATPDAVVRTAGALRAACDAAERQLPAAGPFACGEAFSHVDCLAAPHLQRLTSLVGVFRPEVLAHLRAADMHTFLNTHFPRLAAWTGALLCRPSVAATYHHEAVVAVKRRAVAAWQGEPMVDTRAAARNALTALLQSRHADPVQGTS